MNAVNAVSHQAPCTPRRSTAAAAGFLALALLAYAGEARAQAESGIQLSPDGKRSLISKDIGGQRWAITYNFDDDTVTGNVFSTAGGEPQFVWCERVSDNGDPNPQTVQITLSCSGADNCRSGSCSPANWKVIAPAVMLPGSFFFPPSPNPDAGAVPTTESELFTYLQRGDYRSFAKESAVHPSTGPHGGSVRTDLNPTLDASLAAGNTSHPIGSASVKELYASDRTTLTGWAVEVKNQADSAGGQGWYWYEIFSTTNAANPIAGQGNSVCTGCHSSGQDFVRAPYPLQ